MEMKRKKIMSCLLCLTFVVKRSEIYFLPLKSPQLETPKRKHPSFIESHKGNEIILVRSRELQKTMTFSSLAISEGFVFKKQDKNAFFLLDLCLVHVRN